MVPVRREWRWSRTHHREQQWQWPRTWHRNSTRSQLAEHQPLPSPPSSSPPSPHHRAHIKQSHSPHRHTISTHHQTQLSRHPSHNLPNPGHDVSHTHRHSSSPHGTAPMPSHQHIPLPLATALHQPNNTPSRPLHLPHRTPPQATAPPPPIPLQLRGTNPQYVPHYPARKAQGDARTASTHSRPREWRPTSKDAHCCPHTYCAFQSARSVTSSSKPQASKTTRNRAEQQPQHY